MNKIVIVEDSVLTRDGLKTVVPWSSMDCTIVAEAEDGQEGLEKIKRYQPQIVITDIKMNDMDGLEMIKKAKEISPKTLYIILTGHREFDYAREAIDLHAFAYLLKPIDGDVLCDKIRSAVSFWNQENPPDLPTLIVEKIQDGNQQVAELCDEYFVQIEKETVEKRRELLGNLLREIYTVSMDYEYDESVLSLVKTEADVEGFCEMVKLAAWQSMENKIVQEEKYDEAIEQMLQYIRENYMKNIGVKDIASNIHGYSGYYLSKIFKKAMNCSVAEYLTKYRIECAKRMIEDGRKTIKDIALSCGFSDVNYFYKVFTKYVGITTREYKKKEKTKK